MSKYIAPLEFDIRTAYNKADKIFQQLEDTGHEDAIEIVDRNLLAVDSEYMRFVWLIIECKLETRNGKKYGRRN